MSDKVDKEQNDLCPKNSSQISSATLYFLKQ